MTTWNKMYLKLQQKTTRGSQRTPSWDPSSILTQKIRQKAEVCFVFKLKNSIRIGSSCHRSVQVGTSVPWLVNISIFRHLNIRKLFYFLLYQDWISAIQSGGFCLSRMCFCSDLWPRLVLCPLNIPVPSGLDVDGIYRVSGNLAVIQRLRHKADHGN